LNVGFAQVDHFLALKWYDNTAIAWTRLGLSSDFNHGVVAGVYWYAIGAGKNLQLAWTPGAQTYKFKWYGNEDAGHMECYDELSHPGRLPEPVTLVGPADGAVVHANGAVLSCHESENAIGYQLLFGPDPYHMVYLFSDTPSPPSEPVGGFPFQQTWWTVRAYDQYGSTIHADPMHINTESVIAQPVENTATGQTYASIQRAINDAHPGDEIVVSPGVCQYCENINFKGKNLTLRSTNPNDPAVVAATIINGGHRLSVVTFSGEEGPGCVLDGLTITGGMVGISCRDASPTIRHCTIGGGQNSIEFWDGSEPTIVDCTLLGQIQENDPSLIGYWTLDETEGDMAYDSIADRDGTLIGGPVWEPEDGMIDGALRFDGTDDYVITEGIVNPADGPFSVLAWIKGGEPGQVIVSQVAGVNWLKIDASGGTLATELIPPPKRVPVPPLVSGAVVTDDVWHRVAFVWDGVSRSLYVDGTLVAADEQDTLEGSNRGLYIGCGADQSPESFFSGLVDDVRIYNRAVRP
jgi:hypothetical protein